MQLEEKQKYAVWKAADIRKALKEGRRPSPGPPAGDDDLSVPSNTPSGAYVWFWTHARVIISCKRKERDCF